MTIGIASKLSKEGKIFFGTKEIEGDPVLNGRYRGSLKKYKKKENYRDREKVVRKSNLGAPPSSVIIQWWKE